MSVVLSEIWMYPIKSTKGFRVSEAFVEAGGLAYDRRWMIVDTEGRFLTARTHPKMLQVEAKLKDSVLKVSAPGMEILELSLSMDETVHQEVEIWDSRCRGLSMGAEAEAWLSSFLEMSCSLVRASEERPRLMKPSHILQGDGVVSFADAFPILVIGESSLEDLNQRGQMTIPMERFRPNFVVHGAAAFAEDQWSSFAIGKVEFWGGKLCDRCVLTTIDPKSGAKNKEPLKTLATFRKWDDRVYFGLNAAPVTLGLVREGDVIQVLEKK